MTLVSPTQVNPDDEVTDSSVNTPVNQLAGVINGNLDDTNISGLSGSKISAGTLPSSAATTDANVETRMDETLGDFTASGGVWSIISGLNGSMTAAVSYINGKRLTTPLISSKTFTASKDTYVYLDSTGMVQYDPQTNGAAKPSLPADYVPLAKVVTNGSAITSIVDLRFMPGSLRLKHQAIDTITTPTGLTIQFGWDYVQGNGNTLLTKAITFPTTFSTLFYASSATVGAKPTSGGVPTDLTQFTSGFGNTSTMDDLALSGFTQTMNSSSTMNNTFYFGFTWMAIGTI